MAITISEKIISREHTDDQSLERVYNIEGVDGTSGDQDALDALKAEASESYRGMKRGKCRVEPTEKDDLWIGYAPYQPEAYGGFGSPPETGDSLFSFDTGGGTQHITQSRSTVNSYAVGTGTAPDAKGAIGWTKDGIEGVDLVTPVFNFILTDYISDDDIDSDYITALYSLTGRVNVAAFTVDVEGVQMTFAAQEVLFLGASGAKRVGEDWEITKKFAASPNETGLSVGDITGIAKKGWEYLWVRYKPGVDSGWQVDVPMAVYVEQVYLTGDFAPLTNVA